MVRKQKAKKNDIKNFITVAEAAEIRRVSRSAIHELIQRGRLKSERILGRVVLFRAEVEQFEKDRPGPKTSESKR
jgi:excisionase family DNA binding protein